MIGDIDEAIFTKQMALHNGRFIHESPSNIGRPDPDPEVERVRALLRWTRETIQEAGMGSDGNYEELFFYLNQVYEAMIEEYDNPALKPAIDKIQEFIRIHDAVTHTTLREELSPDYLIREACDFVADVVKGELSGTAESLDVMPALVDCVLEFARLGSQVLVGTLNHDTVVEQILGAREIGFADGFVDAESGYHREFDRRALENAGLPATLLKLHGSVSWTVIQDKNGTQKDAQITDPWGFDRYRTEHPGVEFLDMQKRHLIGTHNKMLAYSKPMYWHLFNVFRNRLEDSTTLIVAGYGFRDKGINEIIIDWVDSNPTHTLIVIDPFITKTRSSARPAIQRSFDRWQEKAQLIEVPDRFSEVTWANLRKAISM
jgi:hypothetical protein